MQFNLKEKLENYIRVLTIARKPNADEFKHIAKICAIGTGLVGIIGMVIYFISVLFIG